MTKVVFDLDGVIRSLYPTVRRKFGLRSPTNYFEWDKKGIDIYDLVKKDYFILEKSKPTKYVHFLQKYYKGKTIEIWSWQPYDWIQYSCRWIKKYFSNFKAHWLKPEEKYKQLMKEKNTILVDDYPKHSNYNHIWLIDQPYNKKVKCKVRINTVEDLRNKLEEINEFSQRNF